MASASRCFTKPRKRIMSEFSKAREKTSYTTNEFDFINLPENNINYIDNDDLQRKDHILDPTNQEDNESNDLISVDRTLHKNLANSPSKSSENLYDNFHPNDINVQPLERFDQNRNKLDQSAQQTRLTMLDVPRSSNKIISSNTRETNLRGSVQINKSRVPINIDRKTVQDQLQDDSQMNHLSISQISRDRNIVGENGNNNTLSNQTNGPLYAICIILLIILGLMLIYGWLTRRRNKKKLNHLRDLIRRYLTVGNPSNELRSNNLLRPRLKTSSSDENICERNNRKGRRSFRDCENENETISLVEGTSKRFTSDQNINDGEAIEIDQSIDKNYDEKFNLRPEGFRFKCEPIKREHSLIVAIKSTKPKVKLLRTRIRNFIDDEAKELKTKSEKSVQSSIKARITSILSTILSSIGESKKVIKDEDCVNDLEEGLDVSKQEHSVTLPGRPPSVSGCNTKDLEPMIPELSYPIQNSLSEISMSAISTFPTLGSPLGSIGRLSQPSNQNEICPCLSQEDERFHENLGYQELRSKSQENLAKVCPSHLSRLNESLLRPTTVIGPLMMQNNIKTTNCRSCYSASPTTLRTSENQTTPMYHSTSVFPNDSSHYKHLNTRNLNLTHRPMCKLVDPTNEIRLRRNYENYYDDEHSDPYHSLTASIGMDLASLSLQNSINNDQPTYTNNLTACSKYCHTNGGQIAQPENIQHFNSSMNHQSSHHDQMVKEKQVAMFCCCQNANDFYKQTMSNHPLTNSPMHEQGCLPGKVVADIMENQNEVASGQCIASHNKSPYKGPATVLDCGCNQMDLKQQTVSEQIMGPQMPSPPMSIFVQQPSLASRTPSPIVNRHIYARPGSGDTNNEAKNNSNNRFSTPEGSTHNDSGCQYEQVNLSGSSASDIMIQGLDSGENSSNINIGTRHLYSSERLKSPTNMNRRTSIAGDRISRVMAPESYTSMMVAPRQGEGLSGYHHPLAHRASIASSDPQSGFHGVNQIDQHRLRLQLLHSQHNPSLHYSQTYQRSNPFRTIGASQMSPVQQLMILEPCQGAPNSDCSASYHYGNPGSYRSQHRQSDCSSLYDPTGLAQYPLYPLNTKGSACSSSGGSSSGIGISGSACTNTPTSMHPASINFGNPGDSTRQFNWGQDYPLNSMQMCYFGDPLEESLASQHTSQSQAHQGMHQYHHLEQAYDRERFGPRRSVHQTQPLMNYQLNPDISRVSCRKYSLPIQLEPNSMEKLCCSHNREHKSALSFNRNQLNMMDLNRGSTNFSNITNAPTSGTRSGSDNIIEPEETSSRRDSQTITRQSSFWLEDGSFDSILCTVGPSQINQETQQENSNKPIPLEAENSKDDNLEKDSDSDETRRLSGDIGRANSDKGGGDTRNKGSSSDDEDDDDDEIGATKKPKDSNRVSNQVGYHKKSEDKGLNPNDIMDCPSRSSTSSSGTSPAQSPDLTKSQGRLKRGSSRSLKLMRSRQRSNRRPLMRSLRQRHISSRSSLLVNSINKQITNATQGSVSKINNQNESSSRSEETSYDHDSQSIDEGDFTSK